MTFPFALLQAADADSGQMMLIMLGVITLAVVVVLGKRFFVSMFEVITSPGHSIGYHGKNNTFFFSLMLVILGGLIGLLILTMQQEQISAELKQAAHDTATTIATGNSNAIYRDHAANWGEGKIDAVLQNQVIGNFILYPFLILAKWLVLGLLFMAFAKMFGSQSTLPNVMGAMSFSFFFGAIGGALLLPYITKYILATLFVQSPPAEFPVTAIIGGVLCLYSLILFCMAFSQAAEVSAGQVIIGLILTAIVFGGLGWYLLTQKFVPQAAVFSGQITSFDPSKPGFTIPGVGGGGGYAPPPAAPSEGPRSSGGGVKEERGGGDMGPIGGGGDAGAEGE